MSLFILLITNIISINLNTAGITSNKNATSNIYVAVRNTLHPKANLSKIKKSFSLFSDPIVTSNSAFCTIPFNRAGNLLIIKAKVDSIEGNFILDTGAPQLILNITYFRDYIAIADNQDNAGGITGSVSTASSVNVSNLSFGTIKYFDLEAGRANLGHIENRRGIKILGLLGLQLFKELK